MMFQSFMLGGGWALFALAAAAFSSVFYLVNQYLRQPGHLLVFWMRVVGTLALTPVMTMVAWPENPKFYLIVGLTVIFTTFADIRTFDVAARYGGGMASRLQPLSVWGAFLVWLAIQPSLVLDYAARPFNALGIIAALSGCVYFAMRMNRSPVNRAAFAEMAPALVAYAIVMGLNKYALSLGPMQGAVYGYMYVQCVLSVVTAGGYALWRLARGPAPLPAVQLPALTVAAVPRRAALPLAAVIMAFAWICHMIYKNYAMIFAANPSYVGAIGLTAPVFIAGYYWLTGHREKEEVWSGYGIVACAALLVLFSLR